LSLFDPPAPGRDKRIRLIQALDRIREHHGQEAIRSAGAA